MNFRFHEIQKSGYSSTAPQGFASVLAKYLSTRQFVSQLPVCSKDGICGRGGDDRLARIGAELLGPEGIPRQGHKRGVRLALLAALVLSVVAPAGALANPLLSGYGGPGQGEQAILGGGLVKGGSSGSGGGGASSGASTPTPSLALEESSTSAPAGSGAGGSRHLSGSAQRKRSLRSPSQKHLAGASKRVPTTHTSKYGLASSRSDAGSSQILGLSDGDFVYIFLALALVIATGALMRRLVGAPRATEVG